MSEYILEMRGIDKRFSGVKALDQVSLQLRPNTVHALLGENGAGKSTLMKILFGMYTADAGEVIFQGKPLRVKGTRDALQAGISMVHQELSPVPEMTVAENIFLGREPRRFGFVDEGLQAERTREILDILGIDLDPGEKMKRLSTGLVQMVEIAKAISYDASVIVMDEPTSAITEQEVDSLYRVIRTLKERGVSVIYISHRMDELFQICDEVTVLRDGAYVATRAIAETDQSELVNLMVGRTLNQLYPECRANPGKVVLSVEGLSREGQFENVSFQLREGEILGISGLMGAGRSELISCIFGITKPTAGRISLYGQETVMAGPGTAIGHRMGLLTEDRRETGIFPPLSVRDNMIMPNLKHFKNPVLLSGRRIEEECEEQRRRLGIKTSGLDAGITSLSGGNQQKVLLARWLMMSPDILLVDEPTRGIDVGAKYELHKLLCEMAEKGKAVIMISSELPEVLGISTRILVMHAGRLAGELSREEATQEAIMHMAVDSAAAATNVGEGLR